MPLDNDKAILMMASARALGSKIFKLEYLTCIQSEDYDTFIPLMMASAWALGSKIFKLEYS